MALLPDRTAETVAQWLQAHPGVEVIARDRSSAYAEGARQGASAAIQVADRFHVLQNLREALDQVFTTYPHAFDAVNALERQQPVLLPDGVVAVPVPPPAEPSTPAQQRAVQRQARRQGLHTQIRTLHQQGWTGVAIAQHVGLSLRTVQRDLRTATFAGRKRRSDAGDSLLNPYKPYLLERWNAGCYTAMRLFREIRQRGYGGGYGVVAAYACRLRQAQGLPPGHRRPRQPLPAGGRASVPALDSASGDLAGAAARGETYASRDPAAHSAPRAVAEVAEAIDLAQDFVTLVRQRQPTQLDLWLTRATTSTIEALRRFATGLYEDYEAVKAGVTLPWSSGPVEGHINRLKMLKRQMFGRAHLDLLSRRFLRRHVGPRPPAHGSQHRPTQSQRRPRPRQGEHGGCS